MFTTAARSAALPFRKPACQSSRCKSPNLLNFLLFSPCCVVFVCAAVRAASFSFSVWAVSHPLPTSTLNFISILVLLWLFFFTQAFWKSLVFCLPVSENTAGANLPALRHALLWQALSAVITRDVFRARSCAVHDRLHKNPAQCDTPLLWISNNISLRE